MRNSSQSVKGRLKTDDRAVSSPEKQKRARGTPTRGDSALLVACCDATGIMPGHLWKPSEPSTDPDSYIPRSLSAPSFIVCVSGGHRIERCPQRKYVSGREWWSRSSSLHTARPAPTAFPVLYMLTDKLFTAGQNIPSISVLQLRDMYWPRLMFSFIFRAKTHSKPLCHKYLTKVRHPGLLRRVFSGVRNISQ